MTPILKSIVAEFSTFSTYFFIEMKNVYGIDNKGPFKYDISTLGGVGGLGLAKYWHADLTGGGGGHSWKYNLCHVGFI